MGLSLSSSGVQLLYEITRGPNAVWFSGGRQVLSETSSGSPGTLPVASHAQLQAEVGRLGHSGHRSLRLFLVLLRHGRHRLSGEEPTLKLTQKCKKTATKVCAFFAV